MQQRLTQVEMAFQQRLSGLTKEMEEFQARCEEDSRGLLELALRIENGAKVVG